MRQLFLEKGKLDIKNICEPALEPNTVLVSVSYSYMSAGSGLKTILQQSSEKTLPAKLKKILDLKLERNYLDDLKKAKLDDVIAFGHSCSGQVLAVGPDVKEFRAGDLVACAGIGFANHADIVSIPQDNVVRINDKSFLKPSSLIGLGALAINSLRRAKLQLGDSVGIFGLDAFGQLLLQICKLNGLSVFGFDTDLNKIEASYNLGFKNIFNLKDQDLKAKIESLTKCYGLNGILISPDCNTDLAYSNAFDLVKAKGKIVLTGNYHSGIKFQNSYKKEIDILTSIPCNYEDDSTNFENRNLAFNAQKRDMSLFIDFITEKKLDVSDLTQDEYYVDNAQEALKDIKTNKKIGVVINFEFGKQKEKKQEAEKDFVCAPSRIAKFDKLSLGLVGYGNFAQNTLWPVLKKYRNLYVEAVFDEDVAKVVKAKKQFKDSTVCVGGVDAVLNTDSNLIFISPSVDITVEEIIKCLNQGKALFVAHPLSINLEDIQNLEKYLLSNPKAKFCVGRHRSFSSLVQKIKTELKDKKSPLMINYRFDVGISEEDRTHAQWRHGRIIAQGTHIFDLFYYLTESKPISISVDSLRASNSHFYPTDNFVVQMSFIDGSIASLFLTSMGNSDCGSERMEIFYDKKTIILDDCLMLKGYGLSPAFSERYTSVDNGYSNLITKFLDEIQKLNYSMPIDFQRFVEVAKISNLADAMIFKGGSVSLENQIKENYLD